MPSEQISVASTQKSIADRRQRQRTPEQQKLYEETNRRTRILQERGVPVPANNTFGGAGKAPKGKS